MLESRFIFCSTASHHATAQPAMHRFSQTSDIQKSQSDLLTREETIRFRWSSG